MGKNRVKLFVVVSVMLISCSGLLEGASSVVYETARSLAMGGASVAVADDQQALFSNPAGIGMQSEKSYSFLNGFVAKNDDYDEVDDKISVLNSADNAGSRNTNLANMRQIVGKTGWQSFSNLAYYIGAQGFAMAAYYRETENFAVKNPVSPYLMAEIEKDTLLSGSIARPFNEPHNLFSDRATGWWGATMKFVSRKAADKTYYARDFAALDSAIVKNANLSGATLDFDVGALWQLNNPWKPTIGVFAGNLLSSEFSSEIGNLKRQFAFGASFRPLTGPPERNEKLLLALDYRDEGNDKAAMTKIRMGLEARITSNLYVQTGIRSGYLTGGASLRWQDWRFQFATYAEELGKNPGDDEDRRYAVSADWKF
jgi:hypothetical protein